MTGQIWSLSSNFSSIHNPSSVWSYGSKPNGFQTTGTFSLFTNLVREPNGTGIIAWFEEGNLFGKSWLGVYYNPNPKITILGYGNSNKTFPAKSVCMHPKPDSLVVVRFTAPTNGNYSLDVTFTHVDDKAISRNTGVYIIYNNLETLWETDLVGIEDSDSFKSIDSGVAVRKNETIDFILGIGSDGVAFNDMTLARVDVGLLVANSTNGNQSKSPINVGIIIGSLAASLILVIAAILVYVYYRRHKNKEYEKRDSVTSRADHEVIES